MISKNGFQLSGHETFVLRRLWLPKVFRYSNKMVKAGLSPNFSGEAPMIDLGLGKNMLSSARFWSIASGMLDKKEVRPSQLAELLFNENGLDPHCASVTTKWLVHWKLSSSPSSLTIFWFLFNQVNKPIISRESLYEAFKIFVQKFYPRKASDNTLKRDVEIVLRSYLPVVSAKSDGLIEESLDTLLTGLDLLAFFSKDSIVIRREERKSINNWLFAYSLMDFWEHIEVSLSSLSFIQIAHDLGSPGRVFKLDEDSIVNRLEALETMTNGALIWTEQSGLKVLTRTKQALSDPENFKLYLLKKAYGVSDE